MRIRLFVALALSLTASASAQDDLKPHLARIPPTDPSDSLKTFRTDPGLSVEVVAAEPLVSDPVDIAWDEDGRLYVCEIWNYPGEPKTGEPLGRVRLLTRTRPDGPYDRSVVFAEGLRWPGGVACYDGGVFVLSSPDLWYLKDTDGDGKADLKQKVLTGFGGKTYEVANCPRWGLDNWLYLSGSYAGGTVSVVGPDGQPTGPGIRSRDFRFDPRTRTLEAASGGGEWGQTFDDWGERFACDATHLTWHPVLPRDELAHNPHAAIASEQEMSIPEWTVLFPVSKPEPWKATRQQFWQRWVNTSRDMNAGRFPPTELAPHGFATSACGITVYRGSALGPDYLGDAFVGEPANNVVVRLKLRADGVSVKAQRPDRDARDKREFLASTDNWLRPVNFANGPDGCLYVVAMYREIIEDESAIPEDILKHYDLYSGRDRGRILRIAPERFVSPPPRRLGSAGAGELAAALDHPDGWVRDTAQRLLVTRRPPGAADAVRHTFGSARRPQGKLHALWTLRGIGELDAPTVLAALSDSHPRVREQAVRVARNMAAKSEPVRDRLVGLADDPEVRVRFRAALALGSIDGPAATDALLRIVRRDGADAWVQSAVLASAGGRAAELFQGLAGDQRAPAEVIAGLARQVGTHNDRAAVDAVLGMLTSSPLKEDTGLQRTAFRELADGMSGAGRSLADHFAGAAPPPAVVADLFGRAMRTAQDAGAGERSRVEAVALLAHLPGDDAERLLGELLAPRQPAPVQVAAVRALSARPGRAATELLLSRWAELRPAVRPAAAEALFRRPERVAALLDAVERKRVAPADIDPQRRDELLHAEDPTLRERAQALLGANLATDRKELVARYTQEVAKLTGDPARGAEVFRAQCAACHRPDRGQRVGPNLATLQDRSPATLIAAILDPNRDVKPAYVNYVVRTRDRQDLSGVIAAETESSLTVRQALGVEDVVLRANVERVRSTGRSLMPDGLEAGIDARQMADLLAHLREMRE
jgi:putative membrane-bound dehydrogenase-like protein